MVIGIIYFLLASSLSDAGTLKQKDDKIGELRERVKFLSEENELLRTDLNSCNRKEIDLKREIVKLEESLENKSEPVNQFAPVINHGAVQELICSLENQPIEEVKSRVMAFLNQNKETSQATKSEEIQSATESLKEALKDVQKGFQLQSELLEIYEELQQQQEPSAQQSKINSTDSSAPSRAPQPPTLSGQPQQTITHRRTSSDNGASAVTAPAISPKLHAINTTDGELIDAPRIVRRTGLFAFYSLFLWSLGIITTLLVIEYVSLTDLTIADLPISMSSQLIY